MGEVETRLDLILPQHPYIQPSGYPLHQVRMKQAAIEAKHLADRPKKREKFLAKVWHRLPAIKGPSAAAAAATEVVAAGTSGRGTVVAGAPHFQYFIVDHHHLSLALSLAGVKV